MHISSTLNAQTRSADDIPVVLVTLDGQRKFIRRKDTYKEMQNLVKSQYGIHPDVALQFEVSTWDVCAGESAEITEDTYPLLVSLLDSLSVVWVEDGEDERAMFTPSPTPPLERENEPAFEAEPNVKEDRALYHDHSALDRAPESPMLLPKVESEEDKIAESASLYGDDDAMNTQDDDEEAEGPAAERYHATESDLGPDDDSEPSPAALDADERFTVHVSGPGPNHTGDFMTRGRYRVGKVLASVCKNFNRDPEHTKLMLCIEVPDEDGEIEAHYFECPNDETILRAGVKPNSRLVLRFQEQEDPEGEDQN